MVSPSFSDGTRFAHKAMIGKMAVVLHPFQNLHGAIDGGAFLIAGNQKGNRARRLAALPSHNRWPRRRRRQPSPSCRWHRGRREAAILDFGGERAVGPIVLVAGRTPHRCGRQNRDAVAPVPMRAKRFSTSGVSLSLKIRRWQTKPWLLNRIFEHGQRSAFMGRDGAAADQVLQDGDGIGRAYFSWAPA